MSSSSSSYRNLIGSRAHFDKTFEKLLPILVALLTLCTIVLIPIAFSTFSTINTTGARQLLSGVPLIKMEESFSKKMDKIQFRLSALESLIKKEGPSGPVGPMGPKGPPGAPGPQGINGRKGEEGQGGSKGNKGDLGSSGSPGAIGRPGDPGPKGEPGTGAGSPGPIGPKGEMGPPGEKGESAPLPIPPSITKIGDLEKGESKIFLITCIGLCNVQAHMEVESGDADLYGKEDGVPKIENSNCDNCPLCKSRSSSFTDSCSDIHTMERNSFYLVVVAHKTFRDGKLSISGFNLKSVEEYSGN